MKYKSMKVSELDEVLDELEVEDRSGLKADKVERIENYLETVGTKPEVTYYDILVWAGVKEVYSCNKCKKQMDSEDDMRLHVLEHYPESEHDTILNKLVKDN